MRRVFGCFLLMLSVVAIFVTIASFLLARTIDAGTSPNLPLILGVLALALVAYVIGMSLLTSIRADAPRRGRFPFRRDTPG